MDQPHVDLLAVLFAALVNMTISYFWYSRWLFGELWMQLSNASKELRMISLFWSCLVALVTAYALAFLEALLVVTTVSDGMFVGFLAWLGFVTTTQISQVIWAKTPLKLYLLDTGCKLLIFLAMGGLLGA